MSQGVVILSRQQSTQALFAGSTPIGGPTNEPAIPAAGSAAVLWVTNDGISVGSVTVAIQAALLASDPDSAWQTLATVGPVAPGATAQSAVLVPTAPFLRVRHTTAGGAATWSARVFLSS